MNDIKGQHKREYKRHKEDYRNRNLKIMYGITSADYDRMFTEQNGACAVCGESETSKRKDSEIIKLSVDHDHSTKKVRGLVCKACNMALAPFDNKQWFVQIMRYLHRR